MNEYNIQLFEDKLIRTAWDTECEECYFSIVAVLGILTESPDYSAGRKYRNKHKQCLLKDDGSEPVTYCHRLKAFQVYDEIVQMNLDTSADYFL